MRWRRQWFVWKRYPYPHHKTLYVRLLWFAWHFRWGKQDYPNNAYWRRSFFFGVLPFCMWGKRYK